MFRATQEIYNALSREDGLKVFTEDNGRQSQVWPSSVWTRAATTASSSSARTMTTT